MDQAPLFPLPEDVIATPVVTPSAAAARLCYAQRQQVHLRYAALDELLAGDHQARVVWAFVEAQDLSPLLQAIEARTNTPGRPAIDPKILMGLWLLATLEGVGSARELDRRCETDIAYQWLCGGVSVNYHTLSDFRVRHGEILDKLLTRQVAALLSQGLVTMDRVAQDGVRVRASAGKDTYRRRESLERCYAQAQEQVAALQAQRQGDGANEDRRRRAAQERAAHERSERLSEALAQMQRMESQDAERSPSKRQGAKKLRVSTTDPQAPLMKMANGGYNPAVNVQFASQVSTQVILGVSVGTTTDRGELTPMLTQLHERYQRYPDAQLVDGGYINNEALEWAATPAVNCVVYCPPVQSKQTGAKQACDPRKRDTPAILEWRARMTSDHGKTIYRQRAQAECVNARGRYCALTQFTVRGLRKIRAAVLWFALAHNMMRAYRLGAVTV